MKTAYFPRRDPGYEDPFWNRSGVDVTFTRSRNVISIGGWYDSCVGIENDSMSLREFFEHVGITEKDCARAWEGTGR